MPKTDRKRERRAVRQGRHRAAFHADRARRAETPSQQFKAAEDRLLSAVKHAKRGRGVTHEVTSLAREAADSAELRPASRELYETKLADPDLGTALMCLRSAIDRQPDTDRDRLLAHYAGELTREAAEIEGRR